jgi:hypothetical protein
MIWSWQGVVSEELKNRIFSNGLHFAIVSDHVFGFDQNPYVSSILIR